MTSLGRQLREGQWNGVSGAAEAQVECYVPENRQVSVSLGGAGEICFERVADGYEMKLIAVRGQTWLD